LSENLYCGIDIGGTTINIGVMTSEGALLAEKHIASQVNKGVGSVVERISDAILQCGMDVGDHRAISGVGIGIAGLVDTKNGILHEATNLPGWTNVALGAKLQGKLNVPVILDNDANVAALGEYMFGAGRDYPYLMMVTLGTGVGAGLILNGAIFHGAYDAAGEFGHITIDKNGALCACGRRGCVEAYVGTRGIVRTVEQYLPEHPHSSLAKMDIDTLTPKDIYRQAQLGDELARRVFKIAGENLGYGLGSVVNLLNIQRIILGGGVAAAGDFIMSSAQATLNAVSLNNSAEPVQIVKGTLGAHAGIVGAACLAMAGEKMNSD
jgi:glucokinase